MYAVKKYVTGLCGNDVIHTHSQSNARPDSNMPPALKRFKFLNSKLLSQKSTAATSGNGNMDRVTGQINRYIADVAKVAVTNAMDFWKGKHGSYSKIAPIAEDLMSALVSLASLCNENFSLTSGRRNRMHKTSL
jgi:hypothetical protein